MSEVESIRDRIERAERALAQYPEWVEGIAIFQGGTDKRETAKAVSDGY